MVPRFTRAPLLTAIAFAAALTLTACGGSDTASDDAPAEETTAASPSAAAEKPEGRLLTAAQAKAALPAVTDLPGSGWTAAPTPPDEADPTVTPASCSPVVNEISTDFPGYKSKLAAKENITFTNAAISETDLLFEVASWTDEADSGLPLAAAKLVDQCKSFSATQEGMTLKLTAESLPPLPIGEEQAAVRLTAELQGTKIYLIVFQAKIGHNLVSMVQTSPDATDRSAEYKPALESVVKDLSAA